MQLPGGVVVSTGVLVVLALLTACGSRIDKVDNGYTEFWDQRLQRYTDQISTQEVLVSNRLNELRAIVERNNATDEAVTLTRSRLLDSMFELAKLKGRFALLRRFADFRGTNPTRGNFDAWIANQAHVVRDFDVASLNRVKQFKKNLADGSTSYRELWANLKRALQERGLALGAADELRMIRREVRRFATDKADI